MSESEFLQHLDRLRYGSNSSERNQALKELKMLEMEGHYQEDDLIKLLAEKDFVFQTYAIGALGRLKLEKGIQPLIDLFRESNDPLILPVLLNAFATYQQANFVMCVIEKIEKLLAKKESNASGSSSFLLEQIVVPAMKYLQTSGDTRAERIVKQFLADSDPIVRWHALLTYDKLALPLSDETLNQMMNHDKYALVREQASVMLEKKKRAEQG